MHATQPRRKCVLLCCNQGSQFTSPASLGLLRSAEVPIGMDGKGRASDSVFAERLWRSLKYEEVYLNDYQSPREARNGIAKHLDFYNYERHHQSLGYQTSAEVHFGSTHQTANTAVITH
jgi:putative transposase